MKKVFALFLTVLLLVIWAGAANAAGVSGMTPRTIGNPNISADVTMNISYTRIWKWDIQKSVTPNTWNLFNGDEAISTYTVTVTKSGYTDSAAMSGAVAVSNLGEHTTDTEGLAVFVTLQADSGSGYSTISQAKVNTSAMPELAANATFSYPYSFNFTAIPGATYKVIADVTILNDNMNYGVPTGPSVSATGALPAAPTSELYATVHVTDTWAGAGSPWTFSNSGSVSYPRAFTACDSGIFNNTATITETNQSASASVKINRYALSISKTAAGSYCKKYIWTIDKTGDKTCLSIAPNQSLPVNYTVTVTAKPVNSNFKATGTITVMNPAPIDAVLNSVTDIATGPIVGQVNTSSITFPYTLKAGATLSLPYTMTLPDASARTNTATAVQQNFRYTNSYANKAAIGTKTYSGSTAIAFGQPTVTDGSAVVNDNYFGTLGTVQATASPAVFHYTLKITLTGTSSTGYSVIVSKNLPNIVKRCTDTSWKVTNTATLTTCTTHTVLTDSWTVTITKGTIVYTYTIGYWKTHSCELAKLLPISLGTQGGCKSLNVTGASQAVSILGMSGDASNGINKLYAQLLAAKLNIKNGSSNTAVSSVVSSADAFLAKYNAGCWGSLSSANKALVLSWATTLDNYNNGVIGPGHAY